MNGIRNSYTIKKAQKPVIRNTVSYVFARLRRHLGLFYLGSRALCILQQSMSPISMVVADIQSMQKFNDGYRYLLICIDVFSKYAWVVPLKNKTGPSLVNAFKVILSSGRKPEKIMTDQGTEFLNQHFRALMQKEDIELYNTYNETKASIVERLIRTLKTKMWRYFTAKKNMRYIDILPDLVYSYNFSIHRSIKIRPEKKIWHTLYDHSSPKNVKYKFKIGDQVRISKIKRQFEKGY